MSKVFITSVILLFAAFTANANNYMVATSKDAETFLGKREVLCTINFSVNSVSITTEASEILNLNAPFLKNVNLKEKLVRIEGFSSPEGAKTKNFRLSIDRARAVESFLRVKHGVSLEHYISGFGPSQPENISAAGKRSVQIAIYDNPWSQDDIPVEMTGGQ
jgi:outer membrane protein OmpA-like peptidoglycan-associated protein